MDTRSTTPAPASSRLPTKKNSFHSLREAKENININSSQRPPTTSPTAVSDTSSVSDTAGFNAASVNSNGNGAYGFGFDSRRSSTSSQQSDFRGRTSNGRPGQTRLPRPSPGAPTTNTTTSTKTNTAKTTTPAVAGNRRALSIKDAFKMAEEEEAAAVAAAAQGSPSPAPRPWRDRASRGTTVKGTPTPGASSAAAAARATPMSASESRMHKILSNSPLDIGGRRTARRIGEPPTPTTTDPAAHTTAHQTAHQRGLSEESMQSLNSLNSVSTTAGRSERSSGVPDIRRIRYEEDQARLMVAMGERSGGLFSPKARVSPKIAVAGRELHRRASNSSLSDKSKVPVVSAESPRPSLTTTRSLLSSTASSRARAGSVLKRTSTAPAEAVSPRSARQRPSISSAASPSPISPIRPITKSATAPLLAPPESAEAAIISSPGKSFAWNTDDDFTSDSLMVSNSPPVSTRPESPEPEPVSSPVSHTPAGNPPMVIGSPDLRPRNTKLDEIRQLEIDASLQFPDDSSGQSSTNGEPAPTTDDKNEKNENEQGQEQPTRRPSLPAERQNKTIDEIRARENEGLSKRAISAAKLDEIRQRNAEFRAANFEPHMQQEQEQEPRELLQEEKDDVVARVRARSVFEEEGDVNRGRKLLDVNDNENSSVASSDRETAKNKSISPALSRKSSSSTHSRTESQELLRKLARVTTSVAAVERKDKAPLGARRLREWFSSDNLREEDEISDKLDKSDRLDKLDSKTRGLPRLRDPDTLRPTVGFAQLRRVSSTDSAVSKRLSLAQSDGDPLDRIEAEMKLFAAHGDQSERGSIRAPSPDVGDSDGSKGVAVSSSSGAVDDATPKASKIVNPLLQATPRVTGAYVETPITVKTEKMVPDVKEAPKANDTNGVAHTRQRSKSRSRSRSRSRSASRPRAPLVNSAKPTSARDDLLSIQRDQHMDDSTLDDFDTLIKSAESHDSVKKTDAEIMVTAINGSMEEFDKEITARLNRNHAERQLLLANNLKEETDVSDVDSIPPAPVVTKRKTHQRQSSSVTFKLDAKEAEKVEAKEAKEADKAKEVQAEAKATTEAKDFAAQQTKNEKMPIPSITVTAPISANVPVVSYLSIPVPKLYYYKNNKLIISFVGILLMLFSVWFVAESTTCALYCRPESCQSGQVCHWSPDDPSFGHAIPVKVDQWLTGGQGRGLWAWAIEEVGDLVADAYDAATGTDIQQVDATYFSFDEKRRHRRRLQKRGLLQPWTPSPETRTKIDAWRRAREAREQEAAAAAEAVRQRAAQVHEGEEYDIF